MHVRLDVDLRFLPSETVEVIVENASRHCCDARPDPINVLLQGFSNLGRRRIPPDGAGISAELFPDQTGSADER